MRRIDPRFPAFVAALLATVMACSATGSVPPASRAPEQSSRQAHCDLLDGAVETVRYHVQLLLHLDDAEAYAELREGEAPFQLDPGAFRQAVEILAALSGVGHEIERLRRIAGLLESNLGIKDPFAEGSTSGRQLLELAEGTFAEAHVVLDGALRQAGCPPT